MALKLDILVLAAHPDDAELACSGTIAKHIAQGKKVGIIDLTEGELGTRGSVAARYEEAAAASKILGLSARENLRLPDGFFENSKEHQLPIIAAIRKYRPEIVLANALYDRHPDHTRGAKIAYEACFLAGLRQVHTEAEGQKQEAWRPKALFHYIQDRYVSPDFVIDVSDFWPLKIEAIRAYRSQFFDPNSAEPETYISKPDFLDFIEARAREMGHAIGTTYGEGFCKGQPLGIKDLFDLLP